MRFALLKRCRKCCWQMAILLSLQTHSSVNTNVLTSTHPQIEVRLSVGKPESLVEVALIEIADLDKNQEN